MGTAEKIALVAGGLGIVGRAVTARLDALEDWAVVALSRRAPDFESGARFLSVDLADRADCRAKLADLEDVTHVFYTALAPGPSLAEEARLNTAMLVNLVETLEAGGAPGLRHIQLMQGSKWYGNHLGPYKTPAREDDPRTLAPNFYYDQQDWLAARQEGRAWTWSALRPHGLCGLSIGSPMNQLTALALYATISKALGLPLCFPGKPSAFTAVYQMTEADHLAEGMVWTATERACANQAFNFTNGDFLRWSHLWPRIADFFAMEPGPVRTIQLAAMMADKEPLWTELRTRHGLANHTLTELTDWAFTDFVLACGYDQMSDMNKARNAGWTGANDSQAMYLRLLGRLRAAKIIP